MLKILKNCHVINVENGEISEVAISIQNDEIQSIDNIVDESGSSQIIDMQGAYVLPGLISCHTHLTIVFPFNLSDPNEDAAMTAFRTYRRGQDALKAGVTTVRTVGETNRADIALRKSIAAGWVTGPRIFSAGLGVSVTGGHGHGFTAEADGADDFRKKCREDLLAGANHIKIFLTGGIAHKDETFDEAQMSDEEIHATVEVAKSKGTYVCAHVGDSGPIMRGVKAGVRCFEHTYNLDAKTASAIKEIDGFIVPTLGVTRSKDWMSQHGFEEWTICKAVSAAPDHLESIKTAVKAGVTLVNGTDIPPGDSDDGAPIVVREMEHCVEAGLSPLQAVQTATLNAAKLINSNNLGVIKPGAKADFIATTANPVEDVRNLREIFFVMQGGTVVRDDRE
jgi:imidazolonepropionase-like amidohydrolase